MNAASRLKVPSTFQSSTAGWFTLGRFAIGLAVLIVAAFPLILFGARTFVFDDYGLFGYPLAHYHRLSFWRGEVPLWNPLNDCGLPFLAQWNTLVCYPLSLIYLLLPLPWSLGFYCLFHLFLGGMGMHRLTHLWTGNTLAASVAGVAYSFSGLVLNSLVWPNNIAALGWMPWVICALDRAWQRRGVRSTIQAGVVGALQMLSGAPEIILFTWTVAMLLCAERWLRRRPERGRILLRFGIVAGIATALTAVQLLPFLDLLAHSHRGTGQTNAESAMPMTGWANYLVPLFRCYRSPPGLFFQPGQFWTDSYYLSAGVLAAAISSLWLVRDRRVWCLAGLTGLSLILALGDDALLYDWLRRVFPPLNLVNFPVKFVVPVTFCIPVIAAFAIQRLYDTAGPTMPRTTRVVVLVWLSAIVLLFAILAYARLFPKPYEQWPAMRNNGLARAVALVLTLVILRGGTRYGHGRLGCWLGIALLAVISLDGLTHMPRLNPTAPTSVYAPGLVRFKQSSRLPRHGVSRVMLGPEALKKFQTALLPDVADTYLGQRAGLYFNCNLLEEIPKVDGFYSLYLSEQLETLFALYAPTNGIAPGLADFMGVSQISSEANILEWSERTTYLPCATTGQQPRFADGNATLRGLTDPGFDARAIVYLPPEAKTSLSVSGRTEAKILSSFFAPHRATVQLETVQPSLLTIAQSFYHPWRATIDGRPTNVWRANHAFQVVEVPAGVHTVTLVYADRAFLSGAAVSWATLLGLSMVHFRHFGVGRRKLLRRQERMGNDSSNAPTKP